MPGLGTDWGQMIDHFGAILFNPGRLVRNRPASTKESKSTFSYKGVCAEDSGRGVRQGSRGWRLGLASGAGGVSEENGVLVAWGGRDQSFPLSTGSCIIAPLADLSRRRLLCGLLAGSAALTFGRRALAEEVPVPVARQAELLVRVAAYDRNLPARAQGTVRVLILTNPDDADSRSTAAQMDAALRHFDKIAGLPYDIATIPFPGGAQVAAKCRAEHLSIVYVTPGLDSKVGELAGALNGVDVLSVAALPRYVNQAIVLGFDLVSSKPVLLINLAQSRKQNVAIGAEVLHLMKVIE